jgi:hypothetical protein
LQRKIGEYLIRIKAMTPAQVAAVLEKQDSGDERTFTEVAAELGYLSQDVFTHSLTAARSCRFSPYCHFYNIKKMTPNQLHLKSIFCLQWPQHCAIYQRLRAGKPVSRTLWPGTGLEDN